MTKADLARDFITKNPKIKSKKEIARQLVKKHPNLFSDIENARTVVRAVTGSRGEGDRKGMSDPQLTKFFYNGFERWAKENLNTELRPWDEPFQIPNFKQLNIIADLHSVHLDYKVMDIFLKRTKNKEALLLNGDLMDSESLSRHLKTHNVIEYERELELCHNILKGLKQEFNHVYFKEGNHDFWLERYLLTNARDIFRLRGLELKELLRLGELGVHWIHNLKYIKFGDLDIIHGHEFPGFGNGKFPSVGVLDKWQTFKNSYKVKVLCSHSHRNDQTISRKSKDGKFGYAWVTPAMCRKSPAYAPYSGWDNGWAVVHNNDGICEVELIRL
jgi:hypothetical protein